MGRHTKINFNVALLALFYIALMFQSQFSWLGYIDEIATIIFLVICIVQLSNGRLSKEDRNILISLFLTVGIGIISNLHSRLIDNIPAILIDALWLFKVYVAMIGTAIVLKKKPSRRRIFTNYVVIIAKLFIWISFAFALVNLVTNIGMHDSVRYGIRAYCFIMGNSGHYGLLMACSFSIIMMKGKLNRIEIILYTCIVCGCIVLTTKLMPLLFVVAYVYLTYTSKGKRIKVWQWIVIGIVVVVVGSLQINNYIRDINHPRMRLLIFGFKTLANYFPLGSGFATYGSEMAFRYYSKLYQLYGFNNFYGLSILQPGALNDNYVAMIAGQFGIIGLFLFVFIMVNIYKKLTKSNYKSYQEKILGLSLFFSMIGTSLMSGSFKAGIGMLVFMTMGVLMSYSNGANTNFSIRSVKKPIHKNTDEL